MIASGGLLPDEWNPVINFAVKYVFPAAMLIALAWGVWDYKRAKRVRGFEVIPRDDTAEGE